MGKDAIGVLHYSPDGKVSVHIMGDGYFAYYGDYTVDGSTIVHKLEMASEPSFVGASNVRHAKLRGSTLVLTGEMKSRTIKVTWRRFVDTPRARRRKSARR
jgi:Lipocalin-like domain